VAARTEGITGFAVIKHDGGLALPNGKLGAEFDLSGALFRDAMGQFPAGFIEPLDYLKENCIVIAHGHLNGLSFWLMNENFPADSLAQGHFRVDRQSGPGIGGAARHDQLQPNGGGTIV
jgi:hypothetical protein